MKMKKKNEKKEEIMSKCYFCGYNEAEVKMNLYEEGKIKSICACKICAEYKVFRFLSSYDDLEKIEIEKMRKEEDEKTT
jgi:hypothetical protein